MKKILLSVMTGMLCMVFGAVSAQESAGRSKVVPAEIWTCSYRDGMGPAELEAAIDDWTAWADERELNDYAAWTLTKHYFAAEQDFDFIWLGAWQDGNAMGADTDYPIHRYFRWAKHIELTLGGATTQLLRLGDALAAEAS